MAQPNGRCAIINPLQFVSFIMGLLSGGFMSRRTNTWVRFVGATFIATLVISQVGYEARAESDKRIGVILSITGDTDFIGKPEQDVLLVMEKNYSKLYPDKLPFELEIKDSGGRPEQALILFQQFSKDPKVLAIIGPSTSGESIFLATRTEAARIPLLSLAASRKIVVDERGRPRDWVFKFAQNDNLAAERLMRAMVNNNHQSVALLYSNDGFGKSGATAFTEVVREPGNVRIVHEVGFASDLSQPEPLIAAIPEGADAVVIWGTAPGPALLVKALKRLGNTKQIYLSHAHKLGT